MARKISMGARREVLSAVAERYRSAGRVEKVRVLDALPNADLGALPLMGELTLPIRRMGWSHGWN
jgi:hypothetical protein